MTDSKVRVESTRDARTSDSFRDISDKKSYFVKLTVFGLVGIGFALALLLYNNPVPISSASFYPVVRRRLVAIVAMLIATVCQSLATVAFQSLTNNRVITPSLLGYEALYSTINTSIIFFFGVNALINFSGAASFIIQLILMVIFSLLLYGWLLSNKKLDLQLVLLVGIVLGTGLRSVSTFMRRVLAPSEFDILQAKLFGSVNNASPDSFPIAIPLVLIVTVLLFKYSNKLNVISLGKSISINLGVNHRRGTIYVLFLVSVLMAVSTALVGPLTFFGFLVATFSYEMAKTYDSKYLFSMAMAIGFVVMTSSYFVMNHIFNAQGVVSIIIEMVGGIVFLLMIFKRGIYDSN